MFNLFKSKPKKWTDEELLIQKKKEMENELHKINDFFEMEKKKLKESYFVKMQKLHSSEKQLSIKDIILEAETMKHPLEYEIVDASEKYRKYRFTRGKISPNSLEIQTDEHPNCMFLRVVDRETEKRIVALYYDKVILKFHEAQWDEQHDYAMKYQLRNFLYELMNHAMKKDFYRFPKVISEYKAEEKNLMDEEEYQTALKSLEEKELKEREKIEEKYKQPIEELEQKIKEKIQEEKRQINELNKTSIIETIRIDMRHINKNKKPFHDEMVHDKQVAEKMNHLFFFIIELLERKEELFYEDVYELNSLYERDIQTIWREYTKLDEKKQEEEKERLYRMLEAVHSRLDEINEKIKQIGIWNYEKKMLFMEKKYADYLKKS